MSDRMVWRICPNHKWWSRFGKPKRAKGSKPGTASHDDLVRRDFVPADTTASATMPDPAIATKSSSQQRSPGTPRVELVNPPRADADGADVDVSATALRGSRE